ncbi:hypothetical protein RN001_003925 [Aquatica leii]|uniref:RING-type domain-containing protein n=1 Tax=Aquatica leii TaxID=1421715 RepID=A0AAN7SMJ8_9COLE|nr:hypothetical protein RN001_003925 [Aquatica leii]
MDIEKLYLQRVFFLIATLSRVFTTVSSTSGPEDFPVGAALQLSPGDDTRSFDDDIPNSFISAYLNVTYRDHNELKWERLECGRYGGGYVADVSGIVVHVSAVDNADDHTGCKLPFESSRSDKQLPLPGIPWIALIKRGNCNFEDKVSNAFQSHASGVLVYNDRESPDLDKMKLSSESGRNITAVFTYKLKGEKIAKLLENDSKVFLQMTIASRTTSPTASINKTSVLFVSVTFIVLMIISLAWLVFYYVQRFRYIHAKDRLSKKLCNAARKALSKIPTKNIKSDDNEVQDGECCAICIEPYKVSEVLRMLPCQHEFHKSCIDPWLLEHRTCPMCKMDILRHYGFMFTGSQESILHMEIEEVVGLESQDSDSPRRGGVSPLPQIRTVVLTDRQRSFTSSVDVEERSSRASTPDETTPSLCTRRQQPVRSDLCANCIAAAASLASQDDTMQPNKTNLPSPSVQVQQVLSPENTQVQMTHSAQVQVSDNNGDSKTVNR